MPRHYGHLPPGLPRGDIEDCHDCGVYWYTMPTRKGDVIRWACVLPDRTSLPGQVIWLLGTVISNLPTREAACVAALRQREQSLAKSTQVQP